MDGDRYRVEEFHLTNVKSDNMNGIQAVAEVSSKVLSLPSLFRLQ